MLRQIARRVAVLAASVALLVVFLVTESRAKDPVLPLSIFRLRTLSGANVAGLLLGGFFAALAGVEEHRAGLGSGILNTSQQLGAAIGIAIASSVAASHTEALLHTGYAVPASLTGGFQRAFWVLGAIGLLAVPAIFALVRRNELSEAVAKITVREPQPALATVS